MLTPLFDDTRGSGTQVQVDPSMLPDTMAHWAALWGVRGFIGFPPTSAEALRERPFKQRVILWNGEDDEAAALLGAPCAMVCWSPCSAAQVLAPWVHTRYPTFPAAGERGQYVFFSFHYDTVQILVCFWEGRDSSEAGDAATEIASSVWTISGDEGAGSTRL